MTDGPILSVRDLRTTFYTDQETIRAVDGISFALRRQRSLGIVGESGSGKSVTARSILGLIDNPGLIHEDSEIRYHQPAFVQRVARSNPSAVQRVESPTAPRQREGAYINIVEGEGDGDEISVERGSVDLVAAPDSVVRSVRGSEIAMVFQDAQTSLNPLYTVGNQIKELLNIHRDQRGAEATETAAALLESVGIPDPKRRLKEFPHEFSGGMQQRAAIALALACDPSVLICDEPTTALDVTIQAQILELLRELKDERDLSIVFITHDMGVVAQIAQSVAVMYAGEIVEMAPSERLFGAPQHPYTRGLLESIPGRSLDRSRLPTIEGSVPTPNEAPTSCRYAPRCPKAFDDCDRIHPAMVAVEEEPSHETAAMEHPVAPGETHTAACLLYPSELEIGERRLLHRETTAVGTEQSSVEADTDE